MKTQSVILASLLTAASFSAPVTAQEVSLEEFVGRLMSQAVDVTRHEINMSVQQVVANTAHMFDLDGTLPGGSVSVTDLAQSKRDEQKAAVSASASE